MKEGKCEEAVQLLRDANMRYKNEPEAAFNVQMALVEILIMLVLFIIFYFVYNDICTMVLFYYY